MDSIMQMYISNFVLTLGLPMFHLIRIVCKGKYFQTYKSICEHVLHTLKILFLVDTLQNSRSFLIESLTSDRYSESC